MSARPPTSQVPDLDGVIPPTADEQIFIIFIEFDGEDAVGVAGHGGGAAHFDDELLAGFVVDADLL